MRLGDLVEEVAVVGDNQERAGVLAQLAREPVAGGAVEVVGGLVEEQVLGAADERLGEGHAHLPAAAEVAAGARAILRAEAEAIEDAPDACFDAVAINGVKVVEEPRLPLDQCIERAVAGLFDAARDLFELKLDRQGIGIGAPHLGDQRLLGGEPGLLVEVAEAAAPAPGVAGVRLQLVREQLEDGRLARSVRPHEAGPLAVADDERDIAKHITRPEELGNAIGEEHER